MNAFANVSIGKRIGIGFAVIVALVLIVGGFTSLKIFQAVNAFDGYQSLALSSKDIGEIQANVLETRLSAKDFEATGTEASILAMLARAGISIDLTGEAIKGAKSQEDRELMTGLQADLQEFRDAFEQMAGFQSERNVLVQDVLNTVGPALEAGLTELLTHANETWNAEAVFAASTALRDVLLGRVEAQKFLINNDGSAVARATDRFKSASTAVAELKDLLPDAAMIDKADTVLAGLTEYAGGLTDVSTLTQARDELRDGTLNVLGPKIAGQIEATKQNITAQQDSVGPQLVIDLTNAKDIGLVVTGTAAALGLLLSVLIARGIVLPLRASTKTMTRLADGHLDVYIPSQGLKNELGEMAAAISVFRDNATAVARLADEKRQAEEEAERNKRKAMASLAEEFEDSVGGVARSLSVAAEQMETSAKSLANTAERTSQQAGTVVSETGQAANNVETVASATEQLSASITEVGARVDRSDKISRSAVEEANKANETVKSLVAAADSISHVVVLITDVAEQTNLLALNATIEAARAGDAGKGFAVVASEVKNLANQTSRATDEISEHIETMKSVTSEVVETISSISRTISDMNEISSHVSTAVTEQAAVTKEIAKNVEQAASGTKRVTQAIDEVTTAAGSTGSAAEEILGSAGDLSNKAHDLRQSMDRFLAGIKAA